MITSIMPISLITYSNTLITSKSLISMITASNLSSPSLTSCLSSPHDLTLQLLLTYLFPILVISSFITLLSSVYLLYILAHVTTLDGSDYLLPIVVLFILSLLNPTLPLLLASSLLNLAGSPAL